MILELNSSEFQNKDRFFLHPSRLVDKESTACTNTKFANPRADINSSNELINLSITF